MTRTRETAVAISHHQHIQRRQLGPIAMHAQRMSPQLVLLEPTINRPCHGTISTVQNPARMRHLVTASAQPRPRFGHQSRLSPVEHDSPVHSPRVLTSAVGRSSTADRHVSIESWEEELNGSVVFRRAEGASTIAPWGRPRGSSFNGMRTRATLDVCYYAVRKYSLPKLLPTA